MTRRFAAALLLSAAAPAFAQDAPPAPIIVTAPGGRIDADEAEVLSAAQINAGGNADVLAALARGVPGLTLAEAQGNRWQAGLTWRGYGASSLQGAEQGVAVYLDGARFNQPFGDVLLLDLLPEEALEAAELREASPVFGRNALAGAMLLRSAAGRDRPGVRLRAGLDSFGAVSASVSAGWAGETIDGLIVAEGVRDPGWRDASPSRLARGYLQLGRRGDGWGADLRAIGAVSRLTGNGVAPVELLAARRDAVFTRPDITDTQFGRILLSPWLELGETARLEATLHYDRLARTARNGDLADFEECDDDPGLLCLDGDDPLQDPAGDLIPADSDTAYAVRNTGREATRTAGARLQWRDERTTDNGERLLALGIELEDARTRFRADAGLGELTPAREVLATGPLVSSLSGALQPVDFDAVNTDIAAYASAALPLAPQLSVEAGARWSRNDVTLIDRLGTALNGKHRFERLNPSIEVDYRPTGSLSLNAGFALTSRSPTPAELSCADPDRPCALGAFFVADPPLRQVVAQHWSAGADLDLPRGHARLSLWRADSRDDIRHVASAVRGRAYFLNIGRSRRQGAELSAQVTRGPWRMAASYAFTDAIHRSDFLITSPSNPAAATDGTIAVRRGDRLAGVPRHVGQLSVGFETPKLALTLAGRAQSGQVLIGDEGNDTPDLPGFAVADFMLRWQIGGGLTLTGLVRNIFDRRYAGFGTFAETDEIFLFEAPGAEDPRAYAPGAPRSVAVTIEAKF